MKTATTLFFALCLVLVLSVSEKNAYAATPRSVYIVDLSSVVHLSDLENALPAFQAAVSNDFAPIWGQDATLQVVDAATRVPKGVWAVYVEDDSPYAGALGYHDYGSGLVYGHVFARTTLDARESWQGCLTHELFEMLADPYIDRIAKGKRLWLVEVADPVESDRFNYGRRGADGSLVPISDFVTPAWYRSAGKGPFDFRRHVRRPGQLLRDGYASFWTGFKWEQVYG